MAGFVLRLVRRQEASAATLNNIRRMNPVGFHRLTQLARRILSDFEFRNFERKSAALREQTLAVKQLVLELPCGNNRQVRSAALHGLKQQF